MALFVYELLDADGRRIELRSSPVALAVGPGEEGDYAMMRLADPATLPASPPVPPSPRAWLERLSPQKQAAIMAGAVANPAVLLWVMKAAGEGSIDVTDPEAIAGVAALVAAGVLDSADQALLLAP